MAQAVEWLDAIPVAIFLVQGRRVAFANHCAAALTGCSAHALTGADIDVLFTDLDAGVGWLNPLRGIPLPVTFTSAPVEHEGQPARLITTLKRALLTETREMDAQGLTAVIDRHTRLLDQILAATPDSFILFDRAGHYLYVNPSGFESTGLNAEHVIGKTWRELGFPEEVGFTFERRLEQVFTTGESITYEEQFPTLSGWQDFLTTLTPIRDEQNNVVYTLNTIRDITARKKAELETTKLAAELEQQTRVFDEVLSTTPDKFLMLDREGRFVYASPSALRDMGRSSEQVIGGSWGELGLPDGVGETFASIMAGVFASGDSHVCEANVPTPRWLRAIERIFSPLHDKAGEVVAVVVTDRDITERKHMEEALRESQGLLSSIFETTLVGIAVMDEDGHYVQVNHTYCELYGYTAAELLGSHVTTVFQPEWHERAMETHRRFISGQGSSARSEWTVRRKDGQTLEINAYNNLLVREDGRRFRVVAVIDVTAQKQAQRALEASEQRLTSILNSMEDAVWSVAADGHQLLYANPAIAALTGYSAEDFTADQRLLVEIVHPEERERFSAQMDRAPVEARTDAEYRILRRDGAQRWVHNRFWTVQGANGQRIDGIMTDITDRRQAAEQAMQLAFERERVRILSDFVRDASHEFRTPLSVINTRLYLMERMQDPERQAGFIEGIREQAERILKLVESLITMSRLDSITQMHFQRIDLNRVLNNMSARMEAVARHKELAFTLELAPNALNIQAEPEELLTAITAIFDNAVSFTSPGGHVDIATRRLSSDEVAIEIRDSGVGISAAELQHVFERFYRVDQARSMQGFGLGLPIARKIMEMHDGRIEVASHPGKGSTFRLIFPNDTRPARHPLES